MDLKTDIQIATDKVIQETQTDTSGIARTKGRPKSSYMDVIRDQGSVGG